MASTYSAARRIPSGLKALFLFVSFISIWHVVSRPEAKAANADLKASHSPKQPKSGEDVTITFSIVRPINASEVALQYQVIEPGAYIALDDPAYAESWEKVPMKQGASDGPRSVFTATLPGELQKNRRLIRYRIFSTRTDAVLAPLSEDTQPNYAYFVYDGIPEWKAAINPAGAGKDKEVVTFSAEAMRSVQAYHLISKRQSIENVTWKERMYLGHPNRHDYRYTATLVSDGKVYDHVHIRARGGNWRHAMGKNMWKIDFNKGHNFEAKDDYQRKYETKWGKLNLGACIQQGSYGMRGEHGMIEAVAFRLFNLAGVESPRTHWIQLRIVDGAEENPGDQYAGDFWGLYLATEEVDDEFLEEHHLPDGNIYKMEFGDAKAEHLVEDGPTDRSDVLGFVRAISRNATPDWWQSNVNLVSYYGYRSIVECIHHYDIGGGKNYFYYRNPKTKQWQVVPWDVDLTWGDHMFGDGNEPFFRAGVLGKEPFKGEYERRLAEIRDLLFNPEQCGALIDEMAAIISTPKGGHSMVEADRAKWDYHPIMSSPYSTRGKADPGLFYQRSATHDFRGMLDVMKQYVVERGKWVDGNLLLEADIPAAPKINPAGKLDLAGPSIKVQLAVGSKASQVRWRLAEVSKPGSAERPRKYEINALWETAGGPSADVPTKELDAGHTYRLRAQALDKGGRWSRWSAPVEFTMAGR